LSFRVVFADLISIRDVLRGPKASRSRASPLARNFARSEVRWALSPLVA
jgi:hypothetical protein